MKSTFARMALLAAFGAVFAPGIVAKAHAQKCSNATLQGGYGYTSVGTLLDSYVPPPLAGPFAEIGRQTFDGKGNTEGAATLTANGNVMNVTIQGAYTVNSDCTGTMTLDVIELGATVDLGFVIDDSGKEIRALVTDANVIESREYRKQFSETDNQ